MTDGLVAAVVQLCSHQDVQQNLATCGQLVAEAASRGATLVVLPENFGYIGQLQHKLTLAEPLAADQTGPVVAAMRDLARSHGIHLLLGGTPIRSSDPQRFYNTSVLLDPAGEVIASYRKIHLFDINIPGGAVFTESSCVLPGEELVTAPLGDHRLGLSICYDLRFPELYRRLAAAGATVLTVPAAFTLHTGKDHWFPLLRARAIENQCYVLAAAQHGAHTPQRSSYGKSCIIDPWGAVIAQVSDGDGVALAVLNAEAQQRIRSELPCLRHRRLD